MKYLLDTHLILWAFYELKKVSPELRAILEDRNNEVFFSAVNLWEIAIKQALGQKDFQGDCRLLRRLMLDEGYLELPVLSVHAIEVQGLPLIHKDPFDRILIAQAMVEGITLLTADAKIAQYPGPIRKV